MLFGLVSVFVPILPSHFDLRTFCCLSRRNGDGYIDRDEFALIIRSTGESISEEEIDELLKDGDKNNDGMLDFDGICIKAMMNLFRSL